MILRPYQQRAVGKTVKALQEGRKPLLVGATGMGKTICIGAIGGEVGGRQLVLQHRQELVQQNLAKYRRVNPGRSVGMYTADCKTRMSTKDTTFAMQQTLVRNLSAIPDDIRLLIVDEAHHVAAPTYMEVIEAVLERNPNCQIAGVTATPMRADRKSLRGVFDTVSDQVSIRELVSLGFLVPPRAFVVDVAGTGEQLQALGKTSDWFDQHEVASILDTAPVNAEVIRHWRDKAGGRPTVVFAATVQHAQDVADAFRAAGVAAECVHGAMNDGERRAVFKRFKSGKTTVLTNVMVATEGFDHPPVGCVILLRKCSEKGPLIQMVGRGLRTVDPREFPGVVKRDCVVLDFGSSLLTHGDLEAALDWGRDKDAEPGEAATKVCPTEASETYRVPDAAGAVGCGGEIPAGCKTCPLCGFQFERLIEDNGESTVVELTELDLLEASPFRWVDLFGDEGCFVASGFEAFVGVFGAIDAASWTAIGKTKRSHAQVLQIGDRLQCIAAADDYLRTTEQDNAARKTKRWLDEPATPKQIGWLQQFGYDIQTDMLGQSDFSKYSAACHMNFQFARSDIEAALGVI